MIIESFYLFVKAVTPSGLRFPDEYEYLRVQEIVQFVIASAQLLVMSMGVAYRVQLASNFAKKTAWALCAFLLSIVLLGLSFENVRIFRETVIFVLALLQAGAAVCIYVTCYKLKRLVHNFSAKKDQRSVGTSVL